ncbi:MAG: hypothetical protein KKI14_02290, partial [Nanoarchaeota archaeon]|nr:hypothetical protein [Nanoarchaeota archaeon]
TDDIIKKQIWIYSVRDIARGEEITYNYGFGWDSRNYSKYACKCGSANCVGYILEKKSWVKLEKRLARYIKEASRK